MVVPRIATSVAQAARPDGQRGNEGVARDLRASPAPMWNAVTTYAKSTSASHFRIAAIW